MFVKQRFFIAWHLDSFNIHGKIQLYKVFYSGEKSYLDY